MVWTLLYVCCINNIDYTFLLFALWKADNLLFVVVCFSRATNLLNNNQASVCEPIRQVIVILDMTPTKYIFFSFCYFKNLKSVVTNRGSNLGDVYGSDVVLMWILGRLRMTVYSNLLVFFRCGGISCLWLLSSNIIYTKNQTLSTMYFIFTPTTNEIVTRKLPEISQAIVTSLSRIRCMYINSIVLHMKAWMYKIWTNIYLFLNELCVQIPVWANLV